MTAKGSRLRLMLVAGLAAGLLTGASASSASAATIVAGPSAAATGYLTPAVTIATGEAVSFMNLDVASHDVTARDTYRPKSKGPHKRHKPKPPPRPLFQSSLIGLLQTSPVSGIERLKPGQTYPFYCSIHPNMAGTLTVR